MSSAHVRSTGRRRTLRRPAAAAAHGPPDGDGEDAEKDRKESEQPGDRQAGREKDQYQAEGDAQPKIEPPDASPSFGIPARAPRGPSIGDRGLELLGRVQPG
jgi:hypothetical protein